MARLALRLVVLLVAAVNVAPAGAAPRDPPKTPTRPGMDHQILYATVDVTATEGASQEFTLECPPGWKAGDAGILNPPAGVSLSYAMDQYLPNPPGTPPGPPIASSDRIVDFGVLNKGDKPVRATLWLECLRPRKVKPPPRAAAKRKTTRFVYDPNNRHLLTPYPRCGKRRVPVAFRYSLLGPNIENPRFGFFGPDAGARIVGVRPTAQGHRLTIAPGAASGEGSVTEICWPETLTDGNGAKQRLVLDQRSATTSASPGRSTLRGACGGGQIPIGAPGFEAGPDVRVTPAVDRDGAPLLAVDNPTGAAVPVRMFLSCTKGRVVKFSEVTATVGTTTGPVTIGRSR